MLVNDKKGEHFMKKFSKIMALGLATTIIGSSLVGCGPKKPADVTPKTPAVETDNKKEEEPEVTDGEEQAEVTIRTVSQFGGTDPTAVVYEAKLAEFKEENPMITVEDESATADEAWKAKVATDFAAGNEPDVIFTFTGVDAKVMIEQGKVVSIADIRAEFPDYASNVSEGVLKSVQEFDGNTYAVPVRGFYEGMFVNKKVFEENGLELPTDWAKFETAVETLNANGIVPVAGALGHLPHYWIEHLILSHGGVDVHRNQDIASVKDEWVAGLEHFKTLYDMGAFPKDTNSTNNDIVTEMFNTGKAGMLVDGNWAIGGFENPDDYTVIPLPVVPGGAADPSDIISGFSTGWYITTKAWEDPAKRTAAVKFVEKMTSTDVIRDFVATGGTPSADVGEVEGLPAAAVDGFKMQATAKNIDVPIDSWLAKPAWDKLLSLIPGIATGQEDPAAVVDEVIILSKD